MDIFDYVGNTLRDTFAYFKSRTKHKYEGDRFEEWVVTHSNIQKCPKTYDARTYWKLREWRSDKYIQGWYALSNLAPDLILECTKFDISNTKEKVIAVECKYKNKIDFSLKKKHVLNYEHYCDEAHPPINALYYIFGFEWEGNAPKSVYLIPAKALYRYDKKSNTISFLHNPSNTEQGLWYEKYKIQLDPSIGKKYIQYKSK